MNFLLKIDNKALPRLHKTETKLIFLTKKFEPIWIDFNALLEKRNIHLKNQI